MALWRKKERLADRISGGRVARGGPAVPLRARSAVRVQPRGVSMAERSFAAAGIGNLVESWTTSSTPINTLLRSQLRTMRARSREQGQNNPYMAGFFRSLVSGVLGPNGLRMRPKVMTGMGRGAKPDDGARLAIREAWETWCDRENCDIRQALNFAGLQRSILRSKAEDGEVVVQHIYGAEAGPHGYAVKLIDAELLCVEMNEDLRSGNRVRLGVEIDKNDRPVAYWFSGRAGADDYYSVNRFADLTRISAENITHAFVPTRVGQLRGVPMSFAALFRLHMQGAYEEAALVVARLGASRNPVITTPTGDIPGATSNGNERRISGNPGEPWVLRDGESIQSWDAPYPSGDFAPFQQAMLKGAATGVGMNYPTFANDPQGVNYTSLRHFRTEDEIYHAVLQDYMVSSVLDVIRRNWLASALLRGAIKGARGPLSPANFDRYNRAVWRPHGRPPIEPYKHAMANKVALETKQTSLTRVLEEQGYDIEDLAEDLEREQQVLGKFLEVSGAAGQGQAEG